MVEILEEVHRRLSRLPKHPGPLAKGLKEALLEVRRVVEAVAPWLFSGVQLPPEGELLQDAWQLREGKVPENGAYAFWLHQALRLVSWPEASRASSGGDWQERCPSCGGFPDVGYLDAEGRRFHVCAFCDTPFRSMRLACPYCGETHPGRLAYYEENPYRIHVCRSCGERFVLQDLRLKAHLDLPALRARAAWYALAEEKDVEV